MVRPWDVPMLRHAIGERVRERHARVFATVAVVVFGLSAFSRDNPGTTAYLLAGLVLLFGLAWNPWMTRLSRTEAREARRTARRVTPPLTHAGPPTWRDLVPPGPKPRTGDYGMVAPSSHEPVPTTREAMINLVKRGLSPSLVWTPESDGIVPVWRVPFLLEELASRNRLRDTTIPVSLLFTALYLGSFSTEPGGWSTAALMLFAGWAVYLGTGHARGRAADPETLERELNVVAASWHRATIPSRWTTAMLAALVATGVLQLLVLTASVQAGAVSARWLHLGQWWRLFTAPVLHAGFAHWAFNAAVLLVMGRWMEVSAPRAWLPVTFLLAALAGGTASLFFPPHAVSIGSSGGLMGILGFMAVMGHRRVAGFPSSFTPVLLANFALIGVLGLAVHEMVDNAAHAGGLAAGLLIGLIAVPRSGREPEWRGGPWLEGAGMLALGAILASAAAAIFVTARLFLR